MLHWTRANKQGPIKGDTWSEHHDTKTTYANYQLSKNTILGFNCTPKINNIVQILEVAQNYNLAPSTAHVRSLYPLIPYINGDQNHRVIKES